MTEPLSRRGAVAGLVGVTAASQIASTSQTNAAVDPGPVGFVSPRSFGARGDFIADDTDAFLAAIRSLRGTSSPEQGRGLYLPGGIYRITRTLAFSLADAAMSIWSDTRATIALDDLPDGEWGIDVDYARGATANFPVFSMRNVSLSVLRTGQQKKNGIRTRRVISSRFEQCEFNYLDVAVDMLGDSNLNMFDTCMWRSNVTGWKSSDGIANNNMFLNCQWRYHAGVAFDGRKTGGTVLIGGDFEPHNASPVIVADRMKIVALRFERNAQNEATGMVILDGNDIECDVHSDGGTQLTPVCDVRGNNNRIALQGRSGTAAIVRKGTYGNHVSLHQFDTLVAPGAPIYLCEENEPSNVLHIGSSVQGNSSLIVEAVRSELIPADLLRWTATDCVVSSRGDGGQRVTITGPAPRLVTALRGRFRNLKIVAAATASSAATRPILRIGGGPRPVVYRIGGERPENHVVRTLYATMVDHVFDDPVFELAPGEAGAGHFDLYHLRTASDGRMPE